jgi:hypothetical protein
MAEETGASQLKAEGKRRRVFRNAFPRSPLKKVLALAQKINELGDGEPVPRLIVFDRLGKSPDSGHSRMLVTTSNAYGLTTGSYQAERLGVTERGRSLVTASSEGQRNAVAIKVLFENDLFGQFYERFKNKTVPDVAIAADFLKQTGGLSDADAKVALDVFLHNLKDYGFVQEMSGRQTIVSQDMVNIETPDKDHEDQAEEKEDTSQKQPPVGSSNDGQRRNPPAQLPILPQFNFNIQVQLPENASPETYDAIFKSMAEHLLKG